MKFFNYSRKGEYKRPLILKLLLTILLPYSFFLLVIPMCFTSWTGGADVFAPIYVLIYLIMDIFYTGLLWSNSPLNIENLLMLPVWQSMGQFKDKDLSQEKDKKMFLQASFPCLVSFIFFPAIGGILVEFYRMEMPIVYMVIIIIPILISFYCFFKLYFKNWLGSSEI